MSEVPEPRREAEQARIREEAEARVWTEEESHGRRKSKLRRTLSRWASSSDQHARELRQAVRESGLVPIAEAPDRTRVKLSGTLRTVTLRPRGGVPALEAELFDGSGRDHADLAGPPADHRDRARSAAGGRGPDRRAGRRPCHVQPPLRAAGLMSKPQEDEDVGPGRRDRRGRRTPPARHRARRPARHGRGGGPDHPVHGHLADPARPAAGTDGQRRRGAGTAGASGWCSGPPRSSCSTRCSASASAGSSSGSRPAEAATRTPRRWPTSCPASSTTRRTPPVFAFTCLIGWPVVGFMVGSVTGDPTAWHQDKQVVRLCTRLTWLLALPCAVRVLVQAPVWLAAHAGTHRGRHCDRRAGRPQDRAGLAGPAGGARRDGVAARPQPHPGRRSPEPTAT